MAEGDIRNVNPMAPNALPGSDPTGKTKVRHPSGPVYRQRNQNDRKSSVLNVNLYGVKPQILSKYIHGMAKTEPTYKAKMLGVLDKVARNIDCDSKIRAEFNKTQTALINLEKSSNKHSLESVKALDALLQNEKQRERNELLRERSKQKFGSDLMGMKTTNELIKTLANNSKEDSIEKKKGGGVLGWLKTFGTKILDSVPFGWAGAAAIIGAVSVSSLIPFAIKLFKGIVDDPLFKKIRNDVSSFIGEHIIPQWMKDLGSEFKKFRSEPIQYIKNIVGDIRHWVGGKISEYWNKFDNKFINPIVDRLNSFFNDMTVNFKVFFSNIVPLIRGKNFEELKKQYLDKNGVPETDVVGGLSKVYGPVLSKVLPTVATGVPVVGPLVSIAKMAGKFFNTGEKKKEPSFSSAGDPTTQWLGLIEQASSRYNLDKNLLRALVYRESYGDPNAVSSAGAIGLTQLMPGTAKMLGVTNPRDPKQNIFGGAKYLSDLIDRFGSPELGLAAYNSGPGNVRKYGGIPPFKETQEYVPAIMGRYKMYSSSPEIEQINKSKEAIEKIENRKTDVIQQGQSIISEKLDKMIDILFQSNKIQSANAGSNNSVTRITTNAFG